MGKHPKNKRKTRNIYAAKNFFSDFFPSSRIMSKLVGNASLSLTIGFIYFHASRKPFLGHRAPRSADAAWVGATGEHQRTSDSTTRLTAASRYSRQTVVTLGNDRGIPSRLSSTATLSMRLNFHPHTHKHTQKKNTYTHTHTGVHAYFITYTFFFLLVFLYGHNTAKLLSAGEVTALGSGTAAVPWGTCVCVCVCVCQAADKVTINFFHHYHHHHHHHHRYHIKKKE